MRGVGSFNSDGRTLYVGGLRFDRSVPIPDAIRDVEQQVRRAFGVWGDIVNLQVIPRSAIAFVRYEHRANADMALAAMANQRLDCAELLNVRWAFDDKNPRAVKRMRIERAEAVEARMNVVSSRLDNMRTQGSNVDDRGVVTN